MRALTRDEFLAEANVEDEVVSRLVQVGAIQPLPDGRFDARDERVASMAGALLQAGIGLDDLAWALDSRRFGLRSLGTIFSEPGRRGRRRRIEARRRTPGSGRTRATRAQAGTETQAPKIFAIS